MSATFGTQAVTRPALSRKWGLLQI